MGLNTRRKGSVEVKGSYQIMPLPIMGSIGLYIFAMERPVEASFGFKVQHLRFGAQG